MFETDLRPHVGRYNHRKDEKERFAREYKSCKTERFELLGDSFHI